MIRRLYLALPGPTAVRVAIAAAMVAALLTLVILSYEWLGDLLDTGGSIQ